MSRIPAWRERGQSLTEFALVVPILMIVVFGIFDFSRAMFYLNSVAEAARNGSRIAMVNQDSVYICQSVADQATVLGLPTACASTESSLGIHVGSGCQAIDCERTITVTAQFEPVAPIIGAVLGPITVSSNSTVRLERVCPGPGETTCPVAP
ncbi:MAG TPA: TadE family protein [Candidatus Limnocylindrales bacterium]